MLKSRLDDGVYPFDAFQLLLYAHFYTSIQYRRSIAIEVTSEFHTCKWANEHCRRNFVLRICLCHLFIIIIIHGTYSICNNRIHTRILAQMYTSSQSSSSLRHFKQQQQQPHDGCRGNETFPLFACQTQFDNEIFLPVRDFFLSVNNSMCNFFSDCCFRVNANFFRSLFSPVDLCFECQILVRREKKKEKLGEFFC